MTSKYTAINDAARLAYANLTGEKPSPEAQPWLEPPSEPPQTKGAGIERKTELGRDLQRRADACQEIATRPEPKHASLKGYMRRQYRRTRNEGKAQAYAHAADLADAERQRCDDFADTVAPLLLEMSFSDALSEQTKDDIARFMASRSTEGS